MPGQEHDGFYRCSTQRILTVSDNYSKGFQAPVAIENKFLAEPDSCHKSKEF